MKTIVILITALSITLLLSCDKETTRNNLDIISCEYSPCLEEIEVSADMTPTPISNYVSDNFDSTIKETKSLMCNDNETLFYEVELENDIQLLFDVDGNFVFQEVEVDEEENEIENLPQSIEDYLNMNHPNDTVVQSELEIEYGISFIEVDTDLNKFIFDTVGNLLCMGPN